MSAVTQISITEHTGRNIVSVEENAHTIVVEIIESGGNGEGGESVLQEDIQSIGVPVVGAVQPDDVLTQGSTFTEVMKQIFQQTVPPTYTSPTSSLSSNPSSTQEIGATLSYTLSPTFNQNDAGALTQVLIKRDGTIISNQSDTTPFVDSSRIVQAGNVTYSTDFTYAQGDIKDDNFGNPDPNGRIEAGTITANRSVSGAYYHWYGSDTQDPTDSADIRALGSSFSNSFTLNTESTNTKMIIAIPSTKNLVSVIDQDALNANITANYILSGTLSQVEDGGGNLVSYKVYVLSIATPYSENHRHNVTLS